MWEKFTIINIYFWQLNISSLCEVVQNFTQFKVLQLCICTFQNILVPRRTCINQMYKPKDQTKYGEALETLAHRDITLFRYESPKMVFR